MLSKPSSVPGNRILHSVPATGWPTHPAPANSHLVPLIAGMVGHGLGIEAICFVLALPRKALLDLVVDHGLATPHDRPMRACGGARAWRETDYELLVRAWLENWQVGGIAQSLGRSKESIWAKTRRLGFPRRSRSTLIWPDGIPQPTCQAERPTPAPRLENLPELRPAAGRRVHGTAEELYVTHNAQSGHVDWVSSGDPHRLQRHLSLRRFSGQRPAKIADDMGISLRAITSMLWWLQVPKLPRQLDTDVYDPAVAERNIATLGYKESKCLSNPKYMFWQHRLRRTRSRRDEKAGVYACA